MQTANRVSWASSAWFLSDLMDLAIVDSERPLRTTNGYVVYDAYIFTEHFSPPENIIMVKAKRDTF